ncbi:hypothetical protein TcG_03401 [Trypanosoma cruzi]|nr:hypothetical protein TcG_03401 [Trypanosoma cruzi]
MNGQETGERGWLEHYLDLSADEDARSDGGKQSCFVTSEELFERLQEEPSLDEQTVGVHVYTEPEVSWAPFSLFSGNHHFLVIETSSWWWSIELRDGRIVVQRGKDFSSVQNRCRCRYRRRRFLQNGPCLVFQGTFEWCCLRDLFFSLIVRDSSMEAFYPINFRRWPLLTTSSRNVVCASWLAPVMCEVFFFFDYYYFWMVLVLVSSFDSERGSYDVFFSLFLYLFTPPPLLLLLLLLLLLCIYLEKAFLVFFCVF